MMKLFKVILPKFYMKRISRSRPSPMDIDKPIRKKKRKRTIPKPLRAAVWNTYIGEEIGARLCPICNQHKISQLNFTCGHIVAEAKGGGTTVDNLRPICSQCNLSMGTKNLKEFNSEYFPESNVS